MNNSDIDREESQVLYMLVTATDTGDFESTALAEITVTDINDNAPFFSQVKGT